MRILIINIRKSVTTHRMSNVCAGIGRGQMTVLDEHIAHHKHVQALYKELLKEIKGSETLV